MSGVQSVDRALDLLIEVARRPGGLVDLANRTKLPLTTASRLLATLLSRQVISRDSDGSYGPGVALSGLGGAPVHGPSIQAAAQPHVATLADTLDEAAGLSIPLVTESLTIMQVDQPRPVRVQDWTGFRWPLTAGGSGLVMLATWPSERVDQLLSEPLVACTEATATSVAEVRSQLDQIASCGVCWTHGAYVDGLSSVAAAVVDPAGTAVASVFVYAPDHRLPGTRGSAMVERTVLDAAEAISRDLEAGWPVQTPGEN